MNNDTDPDWDDADVSSRVYVLLLFALALVNVVLLWRLQFFPTQDGPAHLANALLLQGLWRGEPAWVREFFVANPVLEPTCVFHLLLAGLCRFFPPLVAEKLVVSVILLGLPVALLYCLRGVRRGAACYALPA